MVHPTSVLNLVALFPFQILLPQATLNDTACLLGSSSVTVCLKREWMAIWTSMDFPWCCLLHSEPRKVPKFSIMFFGVFLHIHSHCNICNEVKRINPQRMKSTQHHHPTHHCHSAVLVSVMLRLAWDAAARSASHLRPNHKLLRFVDTHTKKKTCGNGWTWWESWGIVNWICLNQMLQQQSQKLRLLLAKLMSPTWSSLSHSLGSMVHMANPLSSLLHRQLDTWKA